MRDCETNLSLVVDVRVSHHSRVVEEDDLKLPEEVLEVVEEVVEFAELDQLLARLVVFLKLALAEKTLVD